MLYIQNNEALFAWAVALLLGKKYVSYLNLFMK